MDTIFLIASHEEFQKAIQEFVSNCCSINTNQTLKDCAEIKLAKNDIMKLFIDSNFDTNTVPELLEDKGWDAERVTFFVNLLNEKKTELLYSSLLNQNSEYGETITSFDWLLKLVLGTSELNTLKYPLLQLILSTEGNGTQKKIMYDINKDMLRKTIDVLEKLDEV